MLLVVATITKATVVKKTGLRMDEPDECAVKFPSL
jgi:hypothetical protein